VPIAAKIVEDHFRTVEIGGQKALNMRYCQVHNRRRHPGFEHTELLTSKTGERGNAQSRRVLCGDIGEHRRGDEIDIDRMI
jgi:hypothetical protein